MKNAIQAAVALLTRSAQDLARCYTMDGKHPSWTHSAKRLHDESVSAADGLLSVAAHITRLESKNRTHLARIALLESQLADETERLDFVLNEELVIYEFREKFRLNNAMGEMPFPGVFESPRAAIDAAIGLAKGGA